MSEQRIVVTIDENGKINARTSGIKGEMCLDELQGLLDELVEVKSVIKTDEFRQKVEVKMNKKVERRLS